jgi:hypothetical protein
MELGFVDSGQLIEKNNQQNINDSCDNYERSPTGHNNVFMAAAGGRWL